jgi:hypothetical protein
METDTAIKGPVLQPLVAVPGAASEAIIVQCGAGEPASIIPCSAGDLVPAEISPRRDEKPTDGGNVSPPLFPQAMSCTAAKRAGLAYVLRGGILWRAGGAGGARVTPYLLASRMWNSKVSQLIPRLASCLF